MPSEPWKYGPATVPNPEFAKKLAHRLSIRDVVRQQLPAAELGNEQRVIDQEIRIAVYTPESTLRMITVTIGAEEYDPKSQKLMLARKRHFLELDKEST